MPLEKIPVKNEIVEHIGIQALAAWNELISFVDTNYGFEPVWNTAGKYGKWEVKYRRSGKTLCSFYVKDGYFTVLIIYGKAEIEKFIQSQSGISPKIAEIVSNTHQYHDGKWIWLDVSNMEFVQDIKSLITIKKKPVKLKESKP